jgi:hypothetical protein
MHNSLRHDWRRAFVTSNHQPIGSISNAHVGRDFEAIAQSHFQHNEGLALRRGFPVLLGAGATEKLHAFDFGSDDPPILIECKSHHWTETGNVPSAKIIACNLAMYFFHLAPARYRKVLFMLRSEHPRRSETLAEYYSRTCAHLFPPTVSIIEFDERLETARSITAPHEATATFRQ